MHGSDADHTTWCRGGENTRSTRPCGKNFANWKTNLDSGARAALVRHMANYEQRLDLAFAALADPTRRAIIARLSSGDATVGELAEPFEIGLPTLLKHIAVLERGGLVSSEKSGRVRTCSLATGALHITDDWLRTHIQTWESRLDRLEAHLARKKRDLK
jgi:DNA-binding transcriptional ArsR family regulator